MKKNLIILTMATASLLLAGCQQKEQNVPERDWSSVEDIFSTQEEPLQTTYYKPYVGYCGDPMPFYDAKNKSFCVYYLQETDKNNIATYHPIWGLRTTDAAHYEPMGELISYGGAEEQDASLGTGSVIYCDEDQTYYFFYTGHAADRTEAVQYATSKDGIKWTKNIDFVLHGLDFGYSTIDFRDPELVKTEDGIYHMFVATRQIDKGVLAEFTSKDCRNWEHKGIFTKMMWDRFYECPNIFRMGDWWYLIYSDQTGFMRKVQYFKGKTLEELAACTGNGDTPTWPDDHEGFLDSRGLYAGKTASDGTNRYLWGWCPRRKGKDNTLTSIDDLMIFGNLVCHRVIQHEDGSLSLGAIEAIGKKYDKTTEVKNTTLSLKEGEFNLINRLGYHNHLSCTVKTAAATDNFAISFCRAQKDTIFYSTVVNSEDGGAKRKINFEQRGKGGKGFIGDIDGYMVPTPADNTYKIDIYTDNSVLVLYVNDNVAYTNRVYGMPRNYWSIDCLSGSIEVTDIKHSEY